MIQISAKQKIWFILSIISFVAFVAFTLVVAFVDVDQVGLSHLNHFFWQRCGKNVVWERITDWLGFSLILAMLGLVALQVWQWALRKSLCRVDQNLWIFDIVCGCLVVVYIFFEIVVVNCRPLLVDGVAKASYPSSHAMLFATVLPLLIWQVWRYIKSKPWCIVLTVVLAVILIIGVVGRLLSGVHWLTDIMAGVIISCCLNCVYAALVKSPTIEGEL